ncbi:hypothetical protein M5K25_027716 [Dendrobium thyrsiflorum]|uniref:Uncharacterized protein n=1 Tax=Dendrobium thyrsiflorum TaxID=117978 RepID=A0ABD0TUP8_DENTH
MYFTIFFFADPVVVAAIVPHAFKAYNNENSLSKGTKPTTNPIIYQQVDRVDKLTKNECPVKNIAKIHSQTIYCQYGRGMCFLTNGFAAKWHHSLPEIRKQAYRIPSNRRIHWIKSNTASAPDSISIELLYLNIKDELVYTGVAWKYERWSVVCQNSGVWQKFGSSLFSTVHEKMDGKFAAMEEMLRKLLEAQPKMTTSEAKGTISSQRSGGNPNPLRRGKPRGPASSSECGTVRGCELRERVWGLRAKRARAGEAATGKHMWGAIGGVSANVRWARYCRGNLVRTSRAAQEGFVHAYSASKCERLVHDRIYFFK